MKRQKIKTYPTILDGRKVQVTIPADPAPPEILADVLRDSLSPQAIAAIAFALRPGVCKVSDPQIHTQVQWFASQLIGLVGGLKSYTDLLNELGY